MKWEYLKFCFMNFVSFCLLIMVQIFCLVLLYGFLIIVCLFSLVIQMGIFFRLMFQMVFGVRIFSLVCFSLVLKRLQVLEASILLCLLARQVMIGLKICVLFIIGSWFYGFWVRQWKAILILCYFLLVLSMYIMLFLKCIVGFLLLLQ